MQLHDDGTTTLDTSMAAAALYGSCPPAVIEAALTRLSPQPLTTMTTPITRSGRANVESTYVRCLQDRAVHPAHQTVMAQRCTNHVDLDTDHSPFISAVEATADIIEEAARS